MDKNVFNYSCYKKFILDQVGGKSIRKGKKSAIAKTLRCQSTYVSQVLHGTANFSLEQAIILNSFFHLHGVAAEYFLNLVQLKRAGSQPLKKYFADKLNEIQKQRLNLKKRLVAIDELSKEQQSTYYSSWIYAAVHIAITIPGLQDAEALATYLRIPQKRLISVIEFLAEMGLIYVAKGKIKPSVKQVRIGRDSDNVIKHHTNWRQQAIDSLDREDINELHYSAVYSIAKSDLLKLKGDWLRQLEKTLETVRNSKEEELVACCIDIFKMQR